MRYTTVLSIAGSDSSGGAGIQADIKTISALGCYAATAITAITVQSTCGVSAVSPVPPDVVAGQVRTVLADLAPQAVKIGMMGDAATVEAVAEALAEALPPCVVVDPVMVSTSGSLLMRPEALDTMRSKVLPLATILTPNVPEAAALAGFDVTDEASCDAAAVSIARLLTGYVLIKGGHFDGPQKTDRLYDSEGRRIASFVGEAVDTPNTHGTGCTLSSAIACFMAQGFGVEEAVRRAKRYVAEAIAAGSGVTTGHGHGPVNHFFSPQKMQAR